MTHWSLKLDDALESYVGDVGLADSYKKVMRSRVNLFRQHGSTIESFRAAALEAGYANRTIEDTISTVCTIMRKGGVAVDPGRRLRCQSPFPTPPKIQDIARCYRFARLASWPVSPERKEWWQGFWVVSVWTALRLGDLKRLRRKHVDGELLRITAAKTGKEIVIPLPPFVLSNLERLPGTDSIFEMTECSRQLRREIDMACHYAKVRRFTPQGLRQCGINLWRRYGGLDTAKIIQGCGLGQSIDHYLDPLERLETAAKLIDLEAMFYS